MDNDILRHKQWLKGWDEESKNNPVLDKYGRLTVTIEEVDHRYSPSEPKFIERWKLKIGDMKQRYVCSMIVKGSKTGHKLYEIETAVDKIHIDNEGVWHVTASDNDGQDFMVEDRHSNSWNAPNNILELLKKLYPDWDIKLDVWSISRITYYMTKKVKK